MCAKLTAQQDFDNRREKLLRGLNIKDGIGVEIGALCRPFVRRDKGRVIYVDYTDSATLREKYRNDPGVNIDEIVEVDAIWGENTLRDAVHGQYVDYVVASHVIEHVPDLITWLREISSILKPQGEVRLIVPDRRFTFDCAREDTRLTDIMLSYLVRARVPQPHSLIDYVMNAVKVSGTDIWTGQATSRTAEKHHNWQDALAVARDVMENKTYHDTHCWTFTPSSFAELMGRISMTGLVDFACEGFHDTVYMGTEFFVSLRRSKEPEYISASWNRMARAADSASPGDFLWRGRRFIRQAIKRSDGIFSAWGSGRSPGRAHPLDAIEPLPFPTDFDPVAYLAANPDVRLAEADPVTHFKHFGWREGRSIA
ncbi:class I SAM-dependent methyltransferase [Paraburkholderia sp. Ac-20342]|uniref:methyltransferase domain-containing protein n=1 Tax=Paraburkholderia sp. Ac-20342 TaxID=2703889 RepID=UPI00197DF676|nr:class I SAM-dependent methyltransferase [Paraburkholderia sp. Ac-20342]MBN3848610.1 class I SAM-dependent methyltransferase [Paraburkholderia sp. Ac-20342]